MASGVSSSHRSMPDSAPFTPSVLAGRGVSRGAAPHDARMVGRHARIAVDPEPPGICGPVTPGAADADARPHAHAGRFDRLTLGHDEVDGLPHRRPTEVEPRVLLGHGERLTQAARAASPVPLAHRTTPGADEVVTVDDLTG